VLSIALLRVVLLVLGVGFVLAFASLFVHGLWIRWRTGWAEPRLERGRASLYRAATEGSVSADDVAVLSSLPPRLQIRVFVELANSLGGSHRAAFAELARRVGLTERAEGLCRSRHWWKRLRGVRLLAAIGGGQETVPSLFRDPHPAVRAEAVEWAAEHATPGIVTGLVQLLAEPRDASRFALLDSLLRIGAPAVAPLVGYLATHDGECAAPALEVAAGLPDSRFAAPALRLCRDQVPAVRALAAALLGAIGGEEAVEVLMELLGDEDAGVRASAAEALGKLGHWPAAPSVARLLRDPAWRVRREAGLALRALGSPGQLLLRRSLADEDRFAAEMSRQILDLPEATVERGVR
jgi:HEAT repeat protein